MVGDGGILIARIPQHTRWVPRWAAGLRKRRLGETGPCLRSITTSTSALRECHVHLRCCGRPDLRARVIHGDRGRRELRYPTANMRLDVWRMGFTSSASGWANITGLAGFGPQAHVRPGNASVLEMFSLRLYRRSLRPGTRRGLYRVAAAWADNDTIDALIAQMERTPHALARRWMVIPASFRSWATFKLPGLGAGAPRQTAVWRSA